MKDINEVKELIDLQKPKRVISYVEKEDGYILGTYYECPKCHIDLEDWQIEHEVNYCNECGQALKWDKEDEDI